MHVRGPGRSEKYEFWLLPLVELEVINLKLKDQNVNDHHDNKCNDSQAL